MSAKITILGDGAMGTTCALLLARNQVCDVTLWSAREENARILREKRENVRLLPGVPIPDSIHLTIDVGEAVENVTLFVLAIPTVYLRPTLGRFTEQLMQNPVPLVSVVKGMEVQTFLRPTEIVNEVIGPRPTAILSGPSHAEEITKGMPASVVVASADESLALEVQRLFASELFRVYTNSDALGVELAGALKNVVAIAAGISDGLGFGDNTKSALLTRGLVEMTRFCTALGAQEETLFGLAGLGDLITTCISPHGRNRRVGELLGSGKTLSQILESMAQVAEGVHTTKSIYEKSRSLGLIMPIVTEIYRVLYDEKDPLQAVQDLMTRELKSED